VEDFLVAGREVNVFLGIASLAATEFGVVTVSGSPKVLFFGRNEADRGAGGFSFASS
jgi:hypothetical protein